MQKRPFVSITTLLPDTEAKFRQLSDLENALLDSNYSLECSVDNINVRTYAGIEKGRVTGKGNAGFRLYYSYDTGSAAIVSDNLDIFYTLNLSLDSAKMMFYGYLFSDPYGCGTDVLAISGHEKPRPNPLDGLVWPLSAGIAIGFGIPIIYNNFNIGIKEIALGMFLGGLIGLSYYSIHLAKYVMDLEKYCDKAISRSLDSRNYFEAHRHNMIKSGIDDLPGLYSALAIS